jgi:predicted nucleic acid-binding protein
VARSVLVDAGPLVALLDRSDLHHAACKRALESIRIPLTTVWPVVAEAMYLLGFSFKAQEALFEMLESAVSLLPLDAPDLPRIRALMKKYRDLPMDLADAALVRVAERERIPDVFTIDRRDFKLYRPRGIGRFNILP